MRQGLMKSLSSTPDNITRDRAIGSWSLQNLMMDGWDDMIAMLLLRPTVHLLMKCTSHKNRLLLTSCMIKVSESWHKMCCILKRGNE